MGYLELNPDYRGDLQDLRNEVHQFAKNEIRPLAREIDQMDAEEYREIGKRPSPYWDIIQKIKEQGYHRMGFPEEYGGVELTPQERHIIHEEFAWGDIATYPMPGARVPQFAALSGDQDLIEKFTIPYLEDKKGDEIFSCWGLTEPQNGSNVIGHGTEQVQRPDIEDIESQLTMEKDGDEYIINGQKSPWVSHAPASTHAAVHVNVDPQGGKPGGALVIVPLDQSGVTKGEPIQKIGSRTDPQGELVFDNVRVPEENIVKSEETLRPGSGPLSHTQHFCSGSALVATTSTGLARAAFEEALSYARERKQGGRPICEHQSVKEKLYSMFEAVETSRAYSRKIIEHLEDDSFTEKSYRHCLTAQVYCKNRAFEVAHDALQIHGGKGIRKDYLVEKLFRDARTWLIADGTSEIHSLETANDVIDNYEIV